MLKTERQAGAEVDSSTTADILPSASIAQNPMLGVVSGCFRNILKIITKKFGRIEICCIFV